jgi:hypothetical protein
MCKANFPTACVDLAAVRPDIRAGGQCAPGCPGDNWAAVNLRNMFVNASPELFDLLTFGVAGAAGILILLLVGMVMGLISAVLYQFPTRLRSAVTTGLMVTILIGLMRDLIMTVVAQWVVRANSFPEWLGWAATAIDAIANFFDKWIFADSG